MSERTGEPPPVPSPTEMAGDLYQTRFSRFDQDRKRELWGVLCESFFQAYVRPSDSVIDMGAGFCEFINTIKCGQKFAVDLNPDTARYAARDVRVIRTPSSQLDVFGDNSVDVVFASNFFEHLPDKAQFVATLQEIHRVLRNRTGRLLILQPNIRLLNGEYWDFLDHHLPLTEKTLIEAVQLVGFAPAELRTRFLPYTTKSRLPQHRWLVRAYLAFRPFQWLLGKQTWMVAVKQG